MEDKECNNEKYASHAVQDAKFVPYLRKYGRMEVWKYESADNYITILPFFHSSILPYLFGTILSVSY